MATNIKNRLRALEKGFGPKGLDKSLAPTEIWLLAAGDPSNSALLWRAAVAQGQEEQDQAVTKLAEHLQMSFEKTQDSIERFKELRQKMIEEDYC